MTAEEIGAKIRYARLERSMTAEELAAKVGVAQDVIGMIESGRVDIRMSTLSAIADALSVPVDSLLQQAVSYGKTRCTLSYSEYRLIQSIRSLTRMDRIMIERIVSRFAWANRAHDDFLAKLNEDGGTD